MHTQEVETIETILRAFEKGDMENLLALLDDKIDFRIDHYKDLTDVSWQLANNKTELIQLLQRLATDIFPRGTKILELNSRKLEDNWVITKFHQEFYYGVEARMVRSLTWILSHTTEGKCDYFRETVTGVIGVEAGM